MEHHTQQLVNPKIEENPLECEYLKLYFQDPLPNVTSMFEAPHNDHGFNSVASSLPDDYNQIPHMGFQGLEDYSPWDFSHFTAFDIANTLSSSSSDSPHCDYNVLVGKPNATVLESFGESSNGQSEVMIGSSGFSNTQCDSVVLDEKPIPTSVDSFDDFFSNSTNLGNNAMIESSGFPSSLCDTLVFDEMLLREMVESLNKVQSDVGQHKVSMKVESSGFSSTQCDEMPISTMVESFDNSSNVPSVFDHHEASMMNESAAAFSSSNCNALALYETPLYETPLSTMVDTFDYSDIPSPDLSDDEVSVMIESEFPSWGTSEISHQRGTSNRRRYNTQMEIKFDALELEHIKQYFNLPLTNAAKELKVGVTFLKRRCRELNIMRWPHRKIKSLNSLIETVKGLGLINEVKMLEENKRLLELVPNTGLTKRTKKLRQSIFKANYNKKKMSLSSSLG